jgi:hypothetical protein
LSPPSSPTGLSTESTNTSSPSIARTPSTESTNTRSLASGSPQPGVPAKLPTRQGHGVSVVRVCCIHLGVRLTNSIINIFQGVIIGASLAALVFLIIIIISVIHIKRRQRLRLQRDRQLIIDPDGTPGDTQVQEVSGIITPFTLPPSLNNLSGLQTPLKSSRDRRIIIDPDGTPGDTQVQEVSGILTPFTLPLSLNNLSGLQTPLKSSLTTTPTMQPHTRDQPDTNQPSRSADLRADAVGDSLVEMVRSVQSMQQQLLLHFHGYLARDGAQDLDQQGLTSRRTSTGRSGEAPLETRSNGTSDAPPIYEE